MWLYTVSLRRLGQVPFKGRSQPSPRARSDGTWNTGARCSQSGRAYVNDRSGHFSRGRLLFFDVSVAHSARMYDYWLGGKENYAADREAAEQALEANPKILPGVRANRAFLRRAVQYLAREVGVRQFLDIGTGLPTNENTHQIAQSVAAESRVV